MPYQWRIRFPRAGFKILAAAHCGKLQFSCSRCHGDPSYKVGCDAPAQAAVWADDEDEFYSCPWKFVHWTVMAWYDEYEYLARDPGTAPRFDQMPAAWLDAVDTYERYRQKFSAKQDAPRDGFHDMVRNRRQWRKKSK